MSKVKTGTPKMLKIDLKNGLSIFSWSNIYKIL
jgi:hypothetical protein